MLPLATAVVDALLDSPPTDLARLLAVPVFGWAAYRDIATRRVPNETWIPLAALGAVLLAIDGWRALGAGGLVASRFLVFVAVSLGLVAPLGYVFWRLGGFGGADAKAVIVLALLFPTYPVFYLPDAALPLVRPYVAVFSLTVLSNTVLVGLAYPVALGARNLLRGRVGLPMFVGRPVAVPDLAHVHGRLLEDADGLTRSGLDVDALRMYLRWRGLTLAELRADPDRYRDPASLPPAADRNDPGDGAVADGMDVGAAPAGAGGGAAPGGTGGGASTGGTASDSAPDETGGDRAPDGTGGDGGQDPTGGTAPGARTAEPEDPWGAAAFMASLDGSAYGTTPDGLRRGLEVVSSRETVWLTPGVPFIVPMFLGLVVGLTYGDLLFALMRGLGLVP